MAVRYDILKSKRALLQEFDGVKSKAWSANLRAEIATIEAMTDSEFAEKMAENADLVGEAVADADPSYDQIYGSLDT